MYLINVPNYKNFKTWVLTKKKEWKHQLERGACGCGASGPSSFSFSSSSLRELAAIFTAGYLER